MATSDEQLKRAADLKLWIEARITELQEEIEKLKEAQSMVDTLLRASSFRPASEVMPQAKPENSQIPEMREVRRDRGGETIAVARITRAKVTIEPVAEIVLRSETPPFKSFLVGKILAGMKAKDEELVSSGKLGSGQELRYNVLDRGGKISSLTVENYRDAERLAEILNTVGWTFSRMLEKVPT